MSVSNYQLEQIAKSLEMLDNRFDGLEKDKGNFEKA